jgi:hypothetical protein
VAASFFAWRAPDLLRQLSHASMLLRAAGKSAIFNGAGIFHQVPRWDRSRLDGRRGLVEVL